jgi:hypothetical protein
MVLIDLYSDATADGKEYRNLMLLVVGAEYCKCDLTL